MKVESTELKVPKLEANFAAGEDQLEREWSAMKAFLQG